MKNRMLLLLLGSLLCIAAVGCRETESRTGLHDSGKEEKGVTLKIAFWGAVGEEEMLKEAAEGIEEAVEGLDGIAWEQFPSVEEFYDTLPTETAIGKMPDIVMLNNEEQKTLIVSGLLEALGELPDEEEYADKALEEWTYDGERYGLPATAAPALFAVNDDMWEASGLGAYPQTWEEVYEAAKVLKAHGYTPICIDIGNLYHVTQYLLSYGGGWNEGVGMDTEANQEAVAYILKMFDEGLAVSAQDKGKTWDGEVFADGECAMSTGGTWYIGAMKENPEVHFTMLPVPHTGQGNGKTFHSYGFSVMRDSVNKEMAKEAIAYLNREEAQEIRMKITGDCPSLVSLWDVYYERYPGLSFMKEELATAQAFHYPVDGDILDGVQNRLKQRIYGENPNLTPEDILNTQ